jgi:uncharacterized membrane protein
MTSLTTIAALLALLGSALIAGVFFAFSSFIMKALAERPAAEGMAAMQSINVVVLNRSFLGTFMGTAVISVVVAVLAFAAWDQPEAPWHLAGALSYMLGTFLVTAAGNVPLNDRLAAVTAGDADAVRVWEHYLQRWTLLNTVRTIAALAAVLLFTVGLMQSAGS